MSNETRFLLSRSVHREKIIFSSNIEQLLLSYAIRTDDVQPRIGSRFKIQEKTWNAAARRHVACHLNLNVCHRSRARAINNRATSIAVINIRASGLFFIHACEIHVFTD